MPFSEFVNAWYSQHEIEWKRSYRKTVRGAVEQHLIPRFGGINVGRITKEEILNFRSALGKLPGRKSKEQLSAAHTASGPATDDGFSGYKAQNFPFPLRSRRRN